MRILVTGGAGFIGSHVVDGLVAQGDEVAVIDDLSRSCRNAVPTTARLAVLDINSGEATAFVAACRPEVVIHLAAQMEVTASIADPVADAKTNVLGTLNILHTAQRAGSRLFVTMSSGGALYGEAMHIPTGEDEPIAPLSPYGASKASTEVYLDLMCRSTAMRCVSLRLSNVYGPRQSTRGEAGVVSIFAKRMLQQQAPTVFGDGRQTRDFVYVTDVYHAIKQCIEEDSAQGAYNISTSKQTTLLELIKALRRPTGYFGGIIHAPGLAGEVVHSCLAWHRAEQGLKWRPRVTLAKGLLQTVQYLRGADISRPEVARRSLA